MSSQLVILTVKLPALFPTPPPLLVAALALPPPISLTAPCRSLFNESEIQYCGTVLPRFVEIVRTSNGLAGFCKLT